MSNVRRHEVDAQLRRWPDCEFLLENISSQKQPTNFVLYASFFFCFFVLHLTIWMLISSLSLDLRITTRPQQDKQVTREEGSV